MFAVPTKTVRCFPKQQAWITSDVKDILNQKKRAFQRWKLDRAEACTGVPATWEDKPASFQSPRKAHPKELNDYRPVALTSHVMKTMERLAAEATSDLRSHHAEDPLPVCVPGRRPLLLRDKLMKMEVDMHLVTWITDYLTGRPQHVRIRDCSSDTVISSTGAPQGTVLSPVLFTPEREYRSLVEDFVEWCTTNHLKLNITKTKEMCIDFRRVQALSAANLHQGVDVEVVRSYRYLGVHLDERLDWSVNTDIVYKKAQSRLYFLRRLGSFRICQKLLLMFYQSVVASVLFYAVVCWGGSISKRDAGRLDRLVRKAGSVLGLELESLTPLAERRALSKLLHKLLHIMDNVHHPLHSTIIRQRSSFSGRLLSQSCSTDRLRNSSPIQGPDVPHGAALSEALMEPRRPVCIPDGACSARVLTPCPVVLLNSKESQAELGWTSYPSNGLELPHTVPADGAVGVEVEAHQVFWTCDNRTFISVLTTVPPHTDSLGVPTKTKAGLVTEDDPLPF
ncbi:hypothetical protein NFI96_017256 [Prochilodus magdalenae]|nr:hypothetical protein NFI96_017256 [Prochilodus magdalenae]